MIKAACTLLNNGQKVQECDATDDDSSTKARPIKNQYLQ
jgi:hypothetical protein